MLRQVSCRVLGLCMVLSVMDIGCLPVPVPFAWYAKHSRTNVDEATARIIIPAETTKEDVFLALGEPDEVSPDRRSLIYRWVKLKFLLIPMTSAAAPIPEVWKQYQLLIAFDEHEVVTRREIQESYTLSPD